MSVCRVAFDIHFNVFNPPKKTTTTPIRQTFCLMCRVVNRNYAENVSAVYNKESQISPKMPSNSKDILTFKDFFFVFDC